MFRQSVLSVTLLLSVLTAPVSPLAADDRPVPPANPKSLEECRAFQRRQTDYAHIAIQKSRECSERNRAANNEDVALYMPSCGGNLLSSFRSCLELTDAAWCAVAGVSEKINACFEKAGAAEQQGLTDASAQNEKQKKVETEKLLQGQYAAAESGSDDLRKSPQHEQARAGRLEQDLAAARRDVETQTALAAKAADDASRAKQAADDTAAELRKSLQEEKERAGRLEQDLAAARRDVETQAALAAEATDDASQLKQAAEQGSAELKRSLQKEHERAETLAKDLSMAHTAIYAYEAQVRKASDQAADSQQASENGAASLREPLQREQERAGRLEQDLAAARRDVETQTALVARANEAAARSKQAADNESAELKRSLQKEHDRAEALAQNLSMVQTSIYAYEVEARMASDHPAARKQPGQTGALELRKSLVQASARTARLEQELAAARRDVETQTALAAKADAEAVRLRQAADNSSAESLKSLQQERDKTARLEQEPASKRKTEAVPAASGPMTVGRITQDRQLGADEIRPVAAIQTGAAAAGSNANSEKAVEVARLVARASVLLGRGDIGSARIVLERAVEAGNAQARFALAETYDPLVLRKWGAYGTLGDATKARDLYAGAQAGGIKEAKERFDALRR
jgi:hypothetical protein